MPPLCFFVFSRYNEIQRILLRFLIDFWGDSEITGMFNRKKGKGSLKTRDIFLNRQIYLSFLSSTTKVFRRIFYRL